MTHTNTRSFRLHTLAAATTLILAAGSASAAGLANGLAAKATMLRSGDVVTGVLPATQQMHITVALKMRNRDQLDGFIAKAHLATTPAGQHAMSRDQFMANHAPTQEQAQRVAAYLTRNGYTNVVIAPNRMIVTATGTAATAQSAFLASFAKVQTKDGRQAFANTSDVHIPVALQDAVLSIVGLQTVHQMHTFARVVAPNGKQPNFTTQALTGHNPVQFSSIYGGTGVATAAGVTVGIITQGKLTNVLSDLSKFTTNNGLGAVTTQTVQTGATSTDVSGDGEWDLDSQDVVGMGGGQVGKIIFYNEPDLTNAALTANINTAVNANVAKIINMSLGECETDAQGDGSAAADDQLFATAVAQGQTFSISTGDSGADECGNGAHTPSNPADSPYVVAAAGTSLTASSTTWTSETVWSGSGGSESLFEPKPSWQTLWTGTHRGVADIAFDADPNSGATVIVDGASQQIGGTSLAAPIFSGLWARVIAVKGTSVGFAGPLIYQLPASDFHDVTSGSNGISAGVGYDLASGRGSIILSSAINHIGGSTGNVAPVANFSSSTSGLVATFTDSSTDSDGSIASHSWNFGDGSTSTTTSPSHTYAAAGTYSVSETVTDNGGLTNTKTVSVTVTGGTTGGTVLTNGVAVTGLSAATGAYLKYTMVVPAGATGLKFVQSGGTGDSDMYVKFGSAPTDTVYDCRPYVSGNAETCTIATAQAGTYYINLKGYAAFTGVSLTGSYTAGGANTAPTANFSSSVSGLTATFTDSSTDPQGNATITGHSWNFGDGSTSTTTSPSHTYAAAGTYTVTETVTDSGGLTGTKSASVSLSVASCGGLVLCSGTAVALPSVATGGVSSTYTMPVLAGHTVTFATSGGTGDADLYVKAGSAPTSSSYDCRPYTSSTAETCTFTPSANTTYYVNVRAYAAYSGVSLKGTSN